MLRSSARLICVVHLYHGRVSNKALWAIGGSEGVEYATRELFSKLATESIKSVLFADRIFGSLADGFVNAALLTRISLITENYCKLVTIESDKDLHPTSEFILKLPNLSPRTLWKK